MFRLSNDEELDIQTLSEFISEHRNGVAKRYRPLMDAYMTRYPIFTRKAKPDFKPDKRIAVNFAKYIVDTMNGFFIGIPIKVGCDDDDVLDYVEFLDQYNDQDDNNAELSKMCSIYGKGYEMYYTDDESNICITYVSPLEAFMIYDDSVLERPRYFVRTYLDSNNVLHGSVSDNETVRYFVLKGKIQFEDDYETDHGFDGVPATEYRENEEVELIDSDGYGLMLPDRLERGGTLICFASGTGLSAFLSVIKDNPWKRFDNVVVVHCARCADDITLTEAFNEAVKRQNREVNFRFIAATTREPDPSKCGEITRRIPEAIAQGEFEKMGFTLTPQWVRAMICGNPGFVDGVKKALKDRGFTAPRGEKLGTYVAENFW